MTPRQPILASLDLAPGGGFVFATVHDIQAFVPPENIEAAFDTALTYGAA